MGLYLNPPDRALVLCVDEKSQTAGRADNPIGRKQALLRLYEEHESLRGRARPRQFSQLVPLLFAKVCSRSRGKHARNYTPPLLYRK